MVTLSLRAWQVMVFTTRGSTELRYKKSFYNEDVEIVGHVAQRGGGSIISGNIKGQVGWGSEKHNLVVQGNWTRLPLKVPSNQNVVTEGSTGWDERSNVHNNRWWVKPGS